MRQTGIKLPGYKLSKGGRVEKDPRRLSVSQRLKEQARNSKRLRVGKLIPPAMTKTVIPPERLEQKRQERERKHQRKKSFAGSILENDEPCAPASPAQPKQETRRT